MAFPFSKLKFMCGMIATGCMILMLFGQISSNQKLQVQNQNRKVINSKSNFDLIPNDRKTTEFISQVDQETKQINSISSADVTTTKTAATTVKELVNATAAASFLASSKATTNATYNAATTLTYSKTTTVTDAVEKSTAIPSIAQPSEWFSISDLMEATQDARKATVRTFCRRYYPETFASCPADRQGYIHQSSLVSKKYKVVVCDIYKCGFTNWLSAIYVMEDIFTVDDYLNKNIQGSEVIAQAQKILRLQGIQDQNLKQKLWRSSIKVITIRNPFARLVSAYYDKLHRPPSAFYKHVSQYISHHFRHLRRNHTRTYATENGLATFEDFVNYLLAINVDEGDSHFKTFLSQCRPCNAEYDYIIKFETMKNDMEYLKQKLNISAYHRKAVFPLNKFKSNMELTKETFRGIPKYLSVKLYKKYQKDFEIFGYEKPEWLC